MLVGSTFDHISTNVMHNNGNSPLCKRTDEDTVVEPKMPGVTADPISCSLPIAARVAAVAGENVFVDVNTKPNLELDGAIQKLGRERLLTHGFGTEEAETSKLTSVRGCLEVE